MLILLILTWISCNSVEPLVVYPLQCPQHLANLIYLNVDATAFLPLQRPNYDDLVLQATDVSTNLTFTNKCGERISMCKWDLSGNRGGNFHLKLLNVKLGGKEVWSYGDNVFQLPQDLFYCFKHNFTLFSHHSLNSTTYQVDWQTQRWVERYDLIAYHNVSAEEMSPSSGTTSRVHLPNSECRLIPKHGRECEVQFTGLKPCVNFRICVLTRFKSSPYSFTQCINTHLSTHRPGCDRDRDMMPVYAAGVIAVLAAILGVVGFVIIRRRLGHGVSGEKNIYGSGDLGVITPRANYTEMLDMRNVGGESVYFVANKFPHGSHHQDVDDGDQQPNTSSHLR